MILELRALSFESVRGIYTIRGQKNRMPDRALFLAPDAAASFLSIADLVTVSDMLRTPEASLAAVRAKRGAQPPGYSAHNYGLAIDVDIRATMRTMEAPSKRDLDAQLAAYGWRCHRLDGKMGFEAWHYNYLPGVITVGVTRTSSFIEAEIQRRYGAHFVLSDREIQARLRMLSMYRGELDGEIGPLSREALRAFQRAWGLRENGATDARTQRTLALVTAGRELSW